MTLPLSKNKLVVFRCDALGLNYSYQPKGQASVCLAFAGLLSPLSWTGKNIALQSWVLDVPSAWKDKEEARPDAGRRIHSNACRARHCAFWMAQKSLRAGGTTSWEQLGYNRVQLTLLRLEWEPPRYARGILDSALKCRRLQWLSKPLLLRLSVKILFCFLTFSVYTLQAYWNMLVAGTDTEARQLCSSTWYPLLHALVEVKIPIQRWDTDIYYRSLGGSFESSSDFSAAHEPGLSTPSVSQ